MGNRNEIEFDLAGLMLRLKKKSWIIALTVAVLAACGFLTGTLLLPQYTASTQIFVFQEDDDMNYTALQVAT